MIWLVILILTGWMCGLTWKVWQYRRVIGNLCQWQTEVLEELTRPRPNEGWVRMQPTGVYALDEVALGWAEKAERRAHRDVVLARVAASP